MRINFALWGVSLTGGVRVLIEVANRLEQKGHNVTCTILGQPWVYAQTPLELQVTRVIRCEQAQLSPIRARMLKLVDLAFNKSHFPYVREFKTEDPTKILAGSIPADVDANIATFCLSAFAVHRSAKGRPFYYMQHYETLFFNDLYDQRTADESYLLPLIRVANSSWLKQLLKSKCNVASEGPVLPGVDTSVFRHLDGEANRSKRVVALGKSTRWKGIFDLFDALKIVKQSIPDIELVMYGGEPWLADRAPVKSEYKMGLDDAGLARLYSSADAVVVPSWYESSPLVPLEAMACGTPVVATNIGTSDYCQETNSIVVEPRKPKEMSTAILSVLRNESLAESLRKEGRKTASRFTWDKTADSFEKILKSYV